MGRVLKRVPLDFDWPINTLWEGYYLSLERAKELFGETHPFLKEANSKDRNICSLCDRVIYDCSESKSHCLLYYPDNRNKWYKEPPTGDGYQLWETTSEGSPCTPVFETLEELCEYCEKNVSSFADIMLSKEEWMEQLSNNDFVLTKKGNMVFI